jgi:SAM-dependent methyltransferase
VIRKISKRLRGIFTKRSIKKPVSASRHESARSNSLVYSLETPQFHLLRLNAVNRFSGFVFDYNSKPVAYLNVYLDRKRLHRFKVDGLSKDISDHVPLILGARNCRFDFGLYVRRDASKYLFEVVYDDKSSELLFEYNVAEVRSLERWLNRMNSGLADIAMPNSDLVYLTQGIRDSIAYQNSIIPGIYNMKRYLISSGVEINSLQSILDFGCGTGRLIVGWYLDNPENRLYGCDINEDLLDWAKNNLPQRIKWNRSSLSPPLPYPSNCFDLIYLASVFTHLTLASQRSWLNEFKRILSPSGYMLITLQGELYVRLFNPQGLEEFDRKGYIELSTSNEGSNAFSAFHSTEFAKDLFDGFEIIGYFPRGCINHHKILFPVAAFQDIYVLKYSY